MDTYNNPFWYSLPCLPIYIITLPFFLLLLIFCTIVTIIGYRDWAEKQFFRVMHLLP